MIAKAIKGRGIRGASRYVLGPGKNGAAASERISAIAGQGFGFDVSTPADGELAWRVMCHQACAASELKAQAGIREGGRKAEKVALHLVLAWPVDQAPADDLVIRRAREALASIGMGDHQALVVVHRDRRHVHCHAVANRVGADGRVATLSNDHLALSRWAEAVERQDGRLHCGERVQNNARRYGERWHETPAEQPAVREYVKFRQPAGELIDLASRRQGKALPDDPAAWAAAVREQFGPEIWAAGSRSDADRRLAAGGLRLEEAARGGWLVTDGQRSAKLSAVAASMTRLVKAWEENHGREQSGRPDRDVANPPGAREHGPGPGAQRDTRPSEPNAHTAGPAGADRHAATADASAHAALSAAHQRRRLHRIAEHAARGAAVAAGAGGIAGRAEGAQRSPGFGQGDGTAYRSPRHGGDRDEQPGRHGDARSRHRGRGPEPSGDQPAPRATPAGARGDADQHGGLGRAAQRLVDQLRGKSATRGAGSGAGSNGGDWRRRGSAPGGYRGQDRRIDQLAAAIAAGGATADPVEAAKWFDQAALRAAELEATIAAGRALARQLESARWPIEQRRADANAAYQQFDQGFSAFADPKTALQAWKRLVKESGSARRAERLVKDGPQILGQLKGGTWLFGLLPDRERLAAWSTASKMIPALSRSARLAHARSRQDGVEAAELERRWRSPEQVAYRAAIEELRSHSSEHIRKLAEQARAKAGREEACRLVDQLTLIRPGAGREALAWGWSGIPEAEARRRNALMKMHAGEIGQLLIDRYKTLDPVGFTIWQSERHQPASKPRPRPR